MTDYLKELEKENKELVNKLISHPEHRDKYKREQIIIQSKIEGYKIGKAEKCKDTEDKIYNNLRSLASKSGRILWLNVDNLINKIKELSNSEVKE